MELRESAGEAVIFNDLDGADKSLGTLRTAAEGLRLWAPSYANVAEQALERVAAQVKHHRKMAEEHEALVIELASARESRELLQKQLLHLGSEQTSYKNEVLRLQDLMETLRQEKARDLELVTKTYADEQEKLKSQLGAASEEEKLKLQREIKKLMAAQEENRSQLEERARKQEDQLKKTLEENERLIREKEAIEIRRRQEAAVEREQLNLQQVGSMEKLRAEARKVRFPRPNISREISSKIINFLFDENHGSDVRFFGSFDVVSYAFFYICVSLHDPFIHATSNLNALSHSLLSFGVNSRGR